MNRKTEIRIIKAFWIFYATVIVIFALLAIFSCSPKSNTAGWEFHKETANKHHKIKALKVIHCNRE